MIDLEISLTGATANPVTVTYVTANGIGVRGATAGQDFTAPTTGSNTADIPANQLTGTIQIPILNDAIDEPHEVFTVTISYPQNAVLSDRTADSTIIVTINDDEVPEISISASGTATEGVNATADFTITADILPFDSLTIQYLPVSYSPPPSDPSLLITLVLLGILPNTSFLPDGISNRQQITPQPLAFTLVDPEDPTNTTATATLRVPLEDDETYERPGTVSITLQDESPANITYKVHDINDNATLNVQDNDLPKLSIEATRPAVEAPAIQGGVAVFRVTADKDPGPYINLYYNLSESGNFIANEGNNKTELLILARGGRSEVLRVPITQDNDVENDGTITVSLAPDLANPATYEVATSPNNVASLTVYDDDSLPTVSIAVESGGVAENTSPAHFIINATGLTETTTLMINATPIEDGGDFLSSSVEDSIRNYPVVFTDADSNGVNDLTFSGRLPITIVDNTAPGTTGQIKLKLNESSTVYRRGSTTEGTIKIWDNEAPELNVTIIDEIREAEGAMANFVISTGASPNKEVPIRYNLTESGDFISVEGIGKTETLDYTNGKKQHTIAVPIINNTYPENNGTVTLTLLPDQSNPITYTLATDPNHTAELRVIDDESLPVVSLLADSGSAAENTGKARFKLQATNLSATTTLMINATPAENGQFFLAIPVAGTATDYAVEFSDPNGDNVFTGEFVVPLDNDSTRERSGTIKLTLNTSPSSRNSYLLGTTTEGLITVWDDDTPELLIKSAGTVVEVANGMVNFPIEARISPNRLITMNYNLTETGSSNSDFIATVHEGNGKQALLDFRSNRTLATLPIPLNNDGVEESSSVVTVTLIAESGDTSTYTVAESPNNQATATILDDDTPLEVSILSGATTTGVTERYPFDFIVHSNRPVTEDFDVSLFITEASGGTGTLQPSLQGGGNRVTIPSGQQEVSGTVVMATGANVPAGGGTINVSFVPDTTRYTVASNNGSLIIAVKNADTGSSTTPVISLSGPSSVVESGKAIYNLSASHTPDNTNLKVLVKVENTTGDFLANDQAGVKRVPVSSASTPGKLEVLTKADNPDGPAGTIKVSLVEGSGYALPVSANNQQLSTNVVDPSVQDISISSTAETIGVTEGYSFEFTVSSLVNVDADVPVQVTITDENDDDLNPSLQGENNFVTIPLGQRTATGIVEMNIGVGTDGVDPATPGQIKVVVNPVSGALSGQF